MMMMINKLSNYQINKDDDGITIHYCKSEEKALGRGELRLMWGSRRVGGDRPRPRTVWRATGSASQENGKEEKEKEKRRKNWTKPWPKSPASQKSRLASQFA